MVPLSQLGCSPNGALQPREVPEPPRPKSPPDPEADDIACEATEPAHRNQRAEVQRARMGGVPGEQSKQQTVRGRKCEYETVGRIAVLANEVEERGEVRRKQQMGPRDSLSSPDEQDLRECYHSSGVSGSLTWILKTLYVRGSDPVQSGRSGHQTCAVTRSGTNKRNVTSVVTNRGVEFFQRISPCLAQAMRSQT
jgi:hypothetical protein